MTEEKPIRVEAGGRGRIGGLPLPRPLLLLKEVFTLQTFILIAVVFAVVVGVYLLLLKELVLQIAYVYVLLAALLFATIRLILVGRVRLGEFMLVAVYGGIYFFGWGLFAFTLFFDPLLYLLYILTVTITLSLLGVKLPLEPPLKLALYSIGFFGSLYQILALYYSQALAVGRLSFLQLFDLLIAKLISELGISGSGFEVLLKAFSQVSIGTLINVILGIDLGNLLSPSGIRKLLFFSVFEAAFIIAFFAHIFLRINKRWPEVKLKVVGYVMTFVTLIGLLVYIDLAPPLMGFIDGLILPIIPLSPLVLAYVANAGLTDRSVRGLIHFNMAVTLGAMVFFFYTSASWLIGDILGFLFLQLVWAYSWKYPKQFLAKNSILAVSLPLTLWAVLLALTPAFNYPYVYIPAVGLFTLLDFEVLALIVCTLRIHFKTQSPWVMVTVLGILTALMTYQTTAVLFGAHLQNLVYMATWVGLTIAGLIFTHRWLRIGGRRLTLTDGGEPRGGEERSSRGGAVLYLTLGLVSASYVLPFVSTLVGFIPVAVGVSAMVVIYIALTYMAFTTPQPSTRSPLSILSGALFFTLLYVVNSVYSLTSNPYLVVVGVVVMGLSFYSAFTKGMKLPVPSIPLPHKVKVRGRKAVSKSLSSLTWIVPIVAILAFQLAAPSLVPGVGGAGTPYGFGLPAESYIANALSAIGYELAESGFQLLSEQKYAEAGGLFFISFALFTQSVTTVDSINASYKTLYPQINLTRSQALFGMNLSKSGIGLLNGTLFVVLALAESFTLISNSTLPISSTNITSNLETARSTFNNSRALTLEAEEWLESSPLLSQLPPGPLAKIRSVSRILPPLQLATEQMGNLTYAVLPLANGFRELGGANLQLTGGNLTGALEGFNSSKVSFSSTIGVVEGIRRPEGATMPHINILTSLFTGLAELHTHIADAGYSTTTTLQHLEREVSALVGRPRAEVWVPTNETSWLSDIQTNGSLAIAAIGNAKMSLANATQTLRILVPLIPSPDPSFTQTIIGLLNSTLTALQITAIKLEAVATGLRDLGEGLFYWDRGNYSLTLGLNAIGGGDSLAANRQLILARDNFTLAATPLAAGAGKIREANLSRDLNEAMETLSAASLQIGPAIDRARTPAVVGGRIVYNFGPVLSSLADFEDGLGGLQNAFGGG